MTQTLAGKNAPPVGQHSTAHHEEPERFLSQLRFGIT